MSHPYANIPELSQADGSPHVIRIPTEQDVPFTPRIRALVDTPQFQRLRQITQLALSSRVYPGATHTRFEHALGVCHNAIKYLWQLGREPRFADVVSPHAAEVLIAAALLHDIGHWPFCHPIEDMALPGLPSHEAYAREFIGPGTELCEVLRRQWSVEPEEVLNVLTRRPDSATAGLQRSILSGPIDIDKMDYLVRDSAHCGVPYGRQFDRARLIGSLTVNAAGDGLAITSKGRTAAEMMVFARYVMFSEVYWHHAVRSATCMFARAFFELLPRLDGERLFRQTEPELIHSLRAAAAGSPAASLTEGVFGSTRQLHKRLAEYSISEREPLYRRIRQLNSTQLATCSDMLTERLAERLQRPLPRFAVLIDAPPRHREVEFQVDVRLSANLWQPLRAISPVVDAMARTQFDDCVKKVRLFGSPELRPLPCDADELAGLVEESLQTAGC
jgi:HD superfamily phosphohydrolase